MDRCRRRLPVQMLQVMSSERSPPRGEAIVRRIRGQCRRCQRHYRDYAVLYRAPMPRAAHRGKLSCTWASRTGWSGGVRYDIQNQRDVMAYLRPYSSRGSSEFRASSKRTGAWYQLRRHQCTEVLNIWAATEQLTLYGR